MNLEVEKYQGELRELREFKKSHTDNWADAPPGSVQIRGNEIRVKPDDPLPCDVPGFKTLGQRLVDAGVVS